MKLTWESLAESVLGWLDMSFRQFAEKMAMLFSLLVIVAAVVTAETRWIVLGLAVGVPGIVLPYVARRRLWSATRSWLLVGIVVLLDAGVLALISRA